MRLAHLTDLHLPIPVEPTPRELLGKRALGYLSWLRSRRNRHRIDALERIADDCRRAAPQFTAISGDLANISIPAEFSAAAQWLAEHFDPSTTGYCPGNHDAYVPVDWGDGLGRLGPFMAGGRSGDPTSRTPRDEGDFPFVRTSGPVGLVFANSSPPTAPGLATGKLGKDQIGRIGAELLALGNSGYCRVLVLHHPLTEGATHGRKALDDRQSLRAVIFECGVEMVLHGHTHRPVWTSLETRDGPRPVIGGASASHARAYGKYTPARYNLYSIEKDHGTGWRIDAEARELDPVSGAVKTAERRNLLPIST